MYYMMLCQSPAKADKAMLNYKPDHPFRSWMSGSRFVTDATGPAFRHAPPEPIRVEVKPGYEGVFVEFWDSPLPLMSKRLVAALQAAAVTNVDTYQTEIFDSKANRTVRDYVAVNIIGKIAAADLSKSSHDPSIPWFDSVVIDPKSAHEALMFRLAESVNAIVVHEKVKKYLEEHGIDTLTFIPPEQWAG